VSAPRATAAAEPTRRRAPAGPTLADQAREAVLLMIMDRRLKGGEVVVEQRLAAELGVSRTPLREALQRLEGEGMVLKTGRRSFVVRQVTLQTYLQSLKTREVLEAEAAALAAGRAPAEALSAARAGVLALERLVPYSTQAHWVSDDEVHALVIEHCGNAVMAGLLRDLRVTTRLFEIDRLADRLGPDSREHLAIIDALAAGDERAARRTMAAHCRSLIRFAVRELV
jgi:DNA-binding GntR family transcriptional regulator